MELRSVISRDVFTPRDEKLLAVIEVRKRRRRRLTFITSGNKPDYVTFLCLSVTNQKPHEVFITKVKRYEFSPGYERRSHWSLGELRRVDGSDPEKDSPEFGLVFDRGHDQWVAASTAEKCLFVQILYHLCTSYWESRTEPSTTAPPAGQNTNLPASSQQTATSDKNKKKQRPAPPPTEFINCQTKLMGDACSFNIVIYRCKIFLNRMKKSVIEQPNTASRQRASSAKAGGSGSSPPAPRIMGSVGHRASKILNEHDEIKHQTERSKSFGFPAEPVQGTRNS